MSLVELDAAILFSGYPTIPDAMGLAGFEAGEGPRFHPLIPARLDVDKLPIPDPEDGLGYVMNACALSARTERRSAADRGFSGSLWTLATHMVEGGSKPSP